MTGLLPVGFELAAELTFPEPEGTSSGMLILASQVFGIIFTILYSSIFTHFGNLWANLAMCLMLASGTLLIALSKSDLRRQAALTKNNAVVDNSINQYVGENIILKSVGPTVFYVGKQ